ncbi:MAG: hypothetical protein FWF26_00050 [Treponema sp.]|nr:hypothetical protein [Treponema sp.]
MKKRFFTGRLFLTLPFFLLFSLPLGAQGFFSKVTWFVNASILLFPEDNGMYSDPMPVLPSPGFGISYPINNVLRIESTLDCYFTHYGYSYVLDRAVPMAIENRSSFVFGTLFAVQAAAYFNVTSFMTVRAYGGPAADLRVILLAEDLAPDDTEDASRQTGSVRNYFWSSGRWFMPVVGAGADFVVNQRFTVGVDLRVWIPVYRLWSGEHLPAIEGWRFGPGLRFSFK